MDDASKGFSMSVATTIFVCVTCQRTGVPRAIDEARSGEKLQAALAALGAPFRS
jgi:predicted metal-binding protein